MSEKTTIPPKYYQPSIPFDQEEREEIDVYFQDHPEFVRGQKYKQWILEEVREGK